MASYSLNINNTTYNFDIKDETTLLWVLREHLGLTGTKYACGVALCGSCTVHIDGKPVRSCALPISGLKRDQKITTIEGLSQNGDHVVQKAWIEAQAPQCGYCQSGQIMQAAALLAENPSPTREEIKTYMNGNLCRCGTYLRIVKAIKIAAEKTSPKT